MKNKITYMSLVGLSKSLENMKLGEYTKETGKMIKILSLMTKELSEYDKIRVSILERLSGGKKTDDGNYNLGKNQSKREKEFKELLDTEIEIETSFNSIDISKVNGIKGQEVMALYEVLGDFIVL